MPAPDAATDRALLESAVREAGDIARRYYGGAYRRWSKERGSPVTEADLAIDAFLKQRLCAARPSYGWLSEESEDDGSRLTAQTIFAVDPIDGTVAFLKNRPHFTICAAVVHRRRPVAGAVYNPIAEECFTAHTGGGAFLNGAPIRVSARAELEGCSMLADKAMLTHPAWNAPPNRPWPEMRIETRNSIAYRLSLVAKGEFDAMMALSAKRDWDLAAGDIVLSEAGGMASAHDGAELMYNGADAIQPSIVGAGPKLHAALIARVGHIALPKRQDRR
ncbi:MAG TPA: 3'(2'),5'-bisphosphate nucleotidase CysQ [Rhizomicrobium sp.]|nr:3'(2'),5'-bisphosphate nucleotidase CysQ [Rhizomicrobium sp.]